MKNTSITNTAIATATVFSTGVLAGCEYCQPLLLATLVYLVITSWLPTRRRNNQNEFCAS
jgi:hypothetical protein